MTRPRVSVIGLGSPFGDDRAGWEVAERLGALPRLSALSATLRVRLCRTPATELPAMLAEAETAIVVDAVRAGGAPGTIYRLSRPNAALLEGSRLSSHGLGLGAALELVQALGDAPADWLLYGIEAGRAETDPAVARAVIRVTEVLADEIAVRCAAAGGKNKSGPQAAQ